MTSKPQDSSLPANGNSEHPPTITIADSDGRIRAALAKTALADSIRISNGQPPVFGSIRDMISAEVDDMKAALESRSDGEEDTLPRSAPRAVDPNPRAS